MQLGDLSIALDGLVKEEVCKMTGKEQYEFGDLSVELDSRVKRTVADFCGKEEYVPGDLSREVASRVSNRVTEFTGKGECTERRSNATDVPPRAVGVEIRVGPLPPRQTSLATSQRRLRNGELRGFRMWLARKSTSSAI